jgi:tetraacyldisaccharide 4'-kinase
MTMHLARLVKELGHQPAVVSRGYCGEAERLGGVVSDGRSILMGPNMAGDEPYMMAGKLVGIPVIVGKNRYAAGKLAVDKFRADVIVLDDGYQHLKLKRDIDLVLLDCTSPFGNTHLAPRGILREPISSLERATACILTRCREDEHEDDCNRGETIRKYAPRVPLFISSHAPYWYVVEGGGPITLNRFSARHFPPEDDAIKERAVFGFSGIARNAEFQNTVANLGFKVNGFLEFPDHHRYTQPDLSVIQAKAREAGVRRLVTTEKDLVRLLPRNPFALELIVCGVRISFGGGQAKFLSFLKQQLSH